MTTRPPLNVIDDEDEKPSRRAAPKSPRTQSPQPAEVTQQAISRTTLARRANGIRQFNCEWPEDLYIRFASLKLARQARTGQRVTMQMLVMEAAEDLIARERSINLHND